MPREHRNMTDIRRRVLTRMLDAGRPLPLNEVLDQRPGRANVIPQLGRIGWVRFIPYEGFAITDAGRAALASK